MGKLKLTTGRINGFLCSPATPQTFLWDIDVPGLAVRATPPNKQNPTGKKSFIFQGKLDGKDIRMVIGDIRVWDIETGDHSRPGAREEARRLRALIDKGIDPRTEKKERIQKIRDEANRAKHTFFDAVKDYVEKKRRETDSLPLKPRTQHDYLAMVAAPKKRKNGTMGQPGLLYSLADVPLHKIDSDAIRAVHQNALKHGERQAAYAMQVLRAVLNWNGVKIANNPLSREAAGKDRIRVPQSKAAKKPIPVERIGGWWKALDLAANPPTRDYFRFLVLTGARVSEPKKILVKDCDTVAARLTIRDTKNREDHEILFSRQVAAIVKRNIAGKKPEDALFVLADGKKTIATIIDRSGAVFRAKDLRSTFATIAARLVNAYALKDMMNHLHAGDVTGTNYVRTDDDTLRAGWQAVADFIEAKAAEPPPAEVADLDAAREAKSKAAA
ncbi:MAG: integrase family protein [Betaproteobacteria bacterium]|nr:integrase family protein [Betaproteobacteria bacterium]